MVEFDDAYIRFMTKMSTKVSGWGVYCCDFLLLPITPSVSCSCVDALNTHSSELPLSPTVSLRLPLSATRRSLLLNPHPQDVNVGRSGERRHSPVLESALSDAFRECFAVSRVWAALVGAHVWRVWGDDVKAGPRYVWPALLQPTPTTPAPTNLYSYTNVGIALVVTDFSPPVRVGVTLTRTLTRTLIPTSTLALISTLIVTITP